MITRSIALLSLFVSLLTFHSNTNAEPKKFNLGIGTYALTVAYSDLFISDDDFTGNAFIASYAISNNLAIRGNFYSTEHDVFSELEANGSDIVMLFGTGLENEKLKAYLGVGIFNEDWEAFGNSASFNGIQLNAGIGYSWEVIVLDLFVGLRDPSDYDDLAGTDTTVVSASFSLSARF